MRAADVKQLRSIAVLSGQHTNVRVAADEIEGLRKENFRLRCLLRRVVMLAESFPDDPTLMDTEDRRLLTESLMKDVRVAAQGDLD